MVSWILKLLWLRRQLPGKEASKQEIEVPLMDVFTYRKREVEEGSLWFMLYLKSLYIMLMETSWLIKSCKIYTIQGLNSET